MTILLTNKLIKLLPILRNKSSINIIYKWKYKTVGVLPIRIVKSNVLSVGPSSERNIK